MSVANEIAAPSPLAAVSAGSPASNPGPPREKSAHPSAAPRRIGASAQRRDRVDGAGLCPAESSREGSGTLRGFPSSRRWRSELIRHVEAQEVVGELVHLLEVHEVEDPEPEVARAGHDPEVVGRPVGGGEPRVVEDQSPPVVEGKETGPVLKV